MWSLIFLVCLVPHIAGDFLVGRGRSDVTGPASDAVMIGYAKTTQSARGIHTRQYSRAFVVSDNGRKNRVVFVVIDTGMCSQMLKFEVVKLLQQHYGAMYSEKNVIINPTHTHSTPGGYHQYLLYNLATMDGYIKQTFDIMLNGIVKSIRMAHDDLRPARILVKEGELLGAGINRSPTAYMKNPAAERAKYKGNTETTMTVLRFEGDNGPLGAISFFPVHTTSMNNSNRLISGDNKGYASYRMERDFNGGDGKGAFVASFPQGHSGDVSPNTKGAKCVDTGLPCHPEKSTCDDDVTKCMAFGPGKDMFDSTKIIGEKQYSKAKELFGAATVAIQGEEVDFRHRFVNMPEQVVQMNATHSVRGCKPAMGYSFGAGTTDGPGADIFHQSMTESLPWLDALRDLVLGEPSADTVACHAPKPILLSTGEYGDTIGPYAWQPSIVDIQILRLGEVVIVAMPGEFTTMSGRRLRETISQTLVNNGFPRNVKVLLAGLSNTYSSYVTTPEEYQAQRYEGGSTPFGPHTLTVLMQNYRRLAEALAKKTPIPQGRAPPNLKNEQEEGLDPVGAEQPHPTKNFGDVVNNAKPTYRAGSTVKVSFVGANPRNDLKTDSTFLTVERKSTLGTWQIVATDGDWETKFLWDYKCRPGDEPDCEGSPQSTATIEWDIPFNQQPGTYRIRHFGNWKSSALAIAPYEGISREFSVTGV